MTSKDVKIEKNVLSKFQEISEIRKFGNLSILNKF